MSCPPARTGRQHQRYEDNYRLVAGCIPYKYEKEDNQKNYSCIPYQRLRVLMISTPKRDDLVFPKGGWEDDEDLKDAVHREALEEAGVKGILSDEPLGVWEFRSKSREKNNCRKGGCRGHMYAMEVTQEMDSWPEQTIYKRKWLRVDEAFEVCRYDWMRDALRGLVILLSENEREDEETKEKVQLHKSLLLSCSNEHQYLFSPICFDKNSGILCLDKTYTRNCPLRITSYFLGIFAFLFKCGNLFTTFRSISDLQRKSGTSERNANGP